VVQTISHVVNECPVESDLRPLNIGPSYAWKKAASREHCGHKYTQRLFSADYVAINHVLASGRNAALIRCLISVLYILFFALSALTLLVGQQEVHPA